MDAKTEQQAPRPQENLESQLSPEITESIMQKVKDVNEYGNPFSAVSWNYDSKKLRSIFAIGLIGTHKEQEGLDRSAFGNPTNLEAYTKTLKEREKPDVFFNIVGRVGRGRIPPEEQKIENYGYLMPLGHSTIFFTFDLSRFKETTTEDDKNLHSHTFTLYHPTRFLEKYNEKGQTMAEVEYGFRLSPRVPPKFLSGVVFALKRKLNEEEHEEKINQILTKNRKSQHSEGYERDINWIREQERHMYVEETRPEFISQRAKQIAEVMLEVNKNRPDQLIPIYDVHGNLWWPKQINYEEVKKLNHQSQL